MIYIIGKSHPSTGGSVLLVHVWTVFLDFSIPPKNHVVSNYEINVKLMNQYAFFIWMANGPSIIVRVRHPAASYVNKSVIFETYNHVVFKMVCCFSIKRSTNFIESDLVIFHLISLKFIIKRYIICRYWDELEEWIRLVLSHSLKV